MRDAIRDPLTNKVFGATLLSGALSGITFLTVPFALFVGPGFLFGVATGWVFTSVKVKWLDFVQFLLWVAASTGAWYIAVRMYMQHMSTPGNAGGYESFSIAGNPEITNMVVAGLIGSAILAVAFSLLARSVSLKGMALTVCGGILLAAVMYYILQIGPGTNLGGHNAFGSYVKLAAAFAIWQVGVGLSLLAYKRIKDPTKK